MPLMSLLISVAAVCSSEYFKMYQLKMAVC